MQIARHVAQRFLLYLDQFPGELAKLFRLNLQPFRQVMKFLKGLAVGLESVKTRAQGEQKQNADQQEDVPLDIRVDGGDALGGLRLRLVILDQQAGHNLRNHRPARFQFAFNQQAGGLLPAVLGKGEDPVGGAPEFRQRRIELGALVVGGRCGDGKAAFQFRRVRHVVAQPRQFRLPILDGVARARRRHVANRDGHQVGVVLEPQQLQRGLAVPFHHVDLKVFQPANLVDGVNREDHENGKDDTQPRPQPLGRRRNLAQQVVLGLRLVHGLP